MNSSKIIAAAALSLLAAAGAQAQSYEGAGNGVLSVNSARSRSDVNAEALAVARATPQYEGASSAAAPALVASSDRAEVRAQGVAAAHSRTQNLNSYAFYNSVIPTARYANPRITFTR